MNEAAAEREVLRALRLALPGYNSKQLKIANIAVSIGGEKKVETSFRQLVGVARCTGSAGIVQASIDKSDPWFGGRFEIAALTSNLSLGNDYGGSHIDLPGPSFVQLVECELASDVEAFRRFACDASGSDGRNFRDLGRWYRSYILAATSLVESFLSHHVHVHRARGKDVSRLEVPMAFERRVELWLSEFAGGKSIAETRQTMAWGHLLELKRARNEIAHGLSAVMGCSLRQMPRILNHARTGVGEFLIHLRTQQRLEPLGWMLRLRTLPEVEFKDNARP